MLPFDNSFSAFREHCRWLWELTRLDRRPRQRLMPNQIQLCTACVAASRLWPGARASIDEKQKAAALRHGLATIPEAGRARLTSVYRSRMILAIDAR
jgi:hypothetical protein